MATAACVVDMRGTYDHEDAGVEIIYVNGNYDDLAEAALKMMDRNMRVELSACADCKLEE